MLKSKQKAQLKKMAHHLQPIFQVGKEGISDNLCIGISDALEAKELMKIKVLETCPVSINEVMIELSHRTRCEIVNKIGRTITVYRRSHSNPKIELV